MTDKARRSKSQLARDRKRVSELYLKGWLQVDIAKELAVNQSTISRDIKSLIKEWKNDASNNTDELIAHELGRINLLEETYWQQFEASKDPIVRRKTAKKVNGQTTEATQEISLGTGDRRFLQGIQWCVDRRIKLLGLDAPTKTEITGKDGGPIYTISDFSKAEEKLKQWENERQRPDDNPRD